MSTNYSIFLSLQTWLDLVIHFFQIRYDRSDCGLQDQNNKSYHDLLLSTSIYIRSSILKELPRHEDKEKALWRDPHGEQTKAPC